MCYARNWNLTRYQLVTNETIVQLICCKGKNYGCRFKCTVACKTINRDKDLFWDLRNWRIVTNDKILDHKFICESEADLKLKLYEIENISKFSWFLP